jgi:hypothetical protein
MSTVEVGKSTFGQATHTLTIIGQQNPSSSDLKKLHDGYLADLMRAIANGTVPKRDDFQKFLGLGFQVWKTIKLGKRKTVAKYRKALKAAKYRITDYADQILNKISIAETEFEVDLVRVSVRELGFKNPNGTRRDAIYKKALELGLELCPNEVGPALRLAHQDQPRDECNAIGMEPLTASDSDLGLFGVDNDSGEQWLYAYYGDPDSVWGPGDCLVFVLPRKAQA